MVHSPVLGGTTWALQELRLVSLGCMCFLQKLPVASRDTVDQSRDNTNMLIKGPSFKNLSISELSSLNIPIDHKC